MITINLVKHWTVELFLGLVFLFASGANAAVFIVSNANDTVQVTSLRGAIIAANRHGGDNAIILSQSSIQSDNGQHPQIYHLTIGGAHEDADRTGDLDITRGNLTISGQAAGVTIDAAGLGDRVFQVFSNAHLTLSHLTITGGTAPQAEGGSFYYPTFSAGKGGAILNAGVLTLQDCVITNNSSGGGNYNPGNGGGSSGADGGGIYNAGAMTLVNCLVVNNVCGAGYDGADGGNGGGMCNDRTCVLTGCVVRKNGSGTGGSPVGNVIGFAGYGGDGGGIYNAGTMDVERCTIGENHCGQGNNGGQPGWASVGEPGAWGGNGGNGAGMYNVGTLRLNYSAVTGNTTGMGGNAGNFFYAGNGGASGNGGGIFNGSKLTLNSSTISSNFCSSGGMGTLGGQGGSGGGIYNSGSLDMTSCTITLNQTGTGGSGTNYDNFYALVSSGGAGGSGGGIFSVASSTNVITRNSLIALNRANMGGSPGTNTALPTPVGIAGADGLGLDVNGSFTSHGFNLIGTGDGGTGFTNGINVDQAGSDASPIDPLLGPLQNNGGPTPTQALLWGSPAIDQGNSFGVHTDQRGTLRPRDYSFIANSTGGDGSDIGAFEINEILRDRLTVNTNGSGTITPDNNGALLEIDSNYSMTATAKPGFTFINWTDGDVNIITNTTTLKFTMASNLVFTANFTDTGRPSNFITTPIAGLRVSNELFTIRGGTTDNAGVTNVFYSLNGSDWIGADTSDNWLHWSSDVILLDPGTNTLAAYAVDASGNFSTTNKVTFVYVLSAALSVSTNGNGGSIAPIYNNALLQIGINYAMTATAKPGFGFVSWTDGDGNVVTNKATLKFMMAPGLAFTANFVDIARPTLGITNLVTGRSVSNRLFTAKGRAGDNVAVANVSYNLNNTGWATAETANNWTNWTAPLDLTAGTNTLSAFATDAAGNLSTTSTVRFVYVVVAPLTVRTNGKGSISPALHNALLRIGQRYTLTATPGLGFVFTNWTDADSLIVTNKPALSFLMASNLSFTANFIDVSKPVVTITAPLATTIAAGEFYKASGRASDNAAVTNVQYQINGGGWFGANTTNHWTNWTVTIDLTPGTNIFSAYAVDSSGNLSATNPVKFVYATAPTNLSGLKAEITSDGSSSPFGVAFGTGTFSQASTDTNNANGVGSYTYTKLTPSTGLLKVTYTAPPAAANGGQRQISLEFSAPGRGRFTNEVSGNSGGIAFTSTPTLVPPSLAGQTAVYVDDQGDSRSLHFTANQLTAVTLQQTTNHISSYTYKTYSPVGGLLKETSSNGVNYAVLTFRGTNYGTAYTEEHEPNGAFAGSGFAVVGLASQRPGGNAPTNLVSRSALVTSVDNHFKLSFDISTFAQLSPVDDSSTNGIGDYTYTRVGPNTGALDLDYTAPPETFSRLFQFIAPNLAYFTNADGTVGAAVLK